MTVLLFTLAGGAIVGLAVGALGGGGGVLAVPVLIYLLGLSPVDAGTASLIIVLATAIVALARHARAGLVSWRTGAVFASAGLIPAIAASALSPYLPRPVLTGAFAVLAVAAAVAMLSPMAAPPAARGSTVLTRHRTSVPVAAGAGLGAVTGLLGVGGGFLTVPTLVTVLSLRMKVAVGTSLLVITITSAAALGTRLLTVGVSLDWPVVAPFIGAAILGAWDGKRLAGRHSGATLQRAFALLLLAIAAFMLVETVT
ncbi:MAG TPA: sulfite exporter TauE/SafE family protein [Micromonosporaceae bacterium]|nr:sulfite exporter TauE/SafE family protein [Micromonosporaceae bacterium]